MVFTARGFSGNGDSLAELLLLNTLDLQLPAPTQRLRDKQMIAVVLLALRVVIKI
jgi:hypothetical protein